MRFKAIIELEETDLISVFCSYAYGDPDEPNAFYDYTALSDYTNDCIVVDFIEDVLGGDEYKELGTISAFKAEQLLRQMAMFRKDGKKKEKENSSTEAKYYTKQLTDFLGLKTEYYTNAGAVHAPHDDPGFVVHNESMYSHHDSICLIAINKKYLLFMEQTWNYGGE
ncbi:MAG: hypothetical protein ACRBFS_27320 [Aureispira sp.]